MIHEQIVERHLREVLGQWHGCQLSLDPQSKNKLTSEDLNRGLKEGQVCDLCEAEVKERMTQMRSEMYNEHDVYFHNDIW